MPPRRNDPCPCGSGRKYKHCCLARDEVEARRGQVGSGGGVVHLTPEVAASARDQAVWEADTFAVPITIATHGDAVISATLVVAGPLVVGAEVHAALAPEPRAVAEAMAQTIRHAAAAVGSWPTRVRIRHQSLVEPLREALADCPTRVERRTTLADLIEPRTGLITRSPRASGPTPWPGAVPGTFEGWGLADDVSAELFAAAAEYHRAAPWRYVHNTQIFYADLPPDRHYACVVLGYAGIQTGIQLNTVADDIWRLLQAPAEWAFDRLEGSVVTLSLEPPDDLEPRYVRHIRRMRWPLADSGLVPHITALNTLAGGLPVQVARDMTTLLRLVPRFVDAHRDLLVGDVGCDTWPEWHDDETGVRLTYRGWTSFTPPTIWPAPTRLASSLPQGAGARPEAALDLPWADASVVSAERIVEVMTQTVVPISEEFGDWLARTGLSPATVARHHGNAMAFLGWLSLSRRTVIEAVSELDLRLYLFGNAIEQEDLAGSTKTLAVPASLKRFFAFLAATRDIRCPWAEGVLAERDAFVARREAYDEAELDFGQLHEWDDELGADLGRRLLLPDDLPGEGIDPEGEDALLPSPMAAALSAELQRRWLLWREEALARYADDPELVRAAILPRQRQWERTPHPQLDGRTPTEALAAERQARTARGGAPRRAGPKPGSTRGRGRRGGNRNG